LGSNFQNGLVISYSGSLTRDEGETVANYAIGQGSLANSNYSISYTGANFAITPKPITGNFTVDATKVYDGNTIANVLTRSLNNVINPDDVTLSGGVANYNTKHVGNNKTVSLTGMSLTGDDAYNYTLSSVATTTANITVRTLNLSNFAADSKEYDGTSVATGIGFTDDRVAGDNLAFGRDAAFIKFKHRFE
jgi:trimeric autotransporter adhesin